MEGTLRRVDLIGANGVGKSTLYSHLVEDRHGRRPRWLTMREAKTKLVTRRLFAKLSPKNLAKAVTGHLPLVGNIFVDSYCRREAERAFATESLGYQQFFERCLSQFHNQKPGRASSCLSLVWLFSRLAEIALLEDLDETVLFDESLSHKVVTLLADSKMLEEGRPIDPYLEAMPPPVAAIHLRASEELIMRRLTERNRRRGGPIARHITLDRRGLRRSTRRTRKISELLAKSLQSRGGEVINLDANEPPEFNVELVQRFLARL